MRAPSLVISLALGVVNLGCSAEGPCLGEALAALEAADPSIEDPEVRRALASGACDHDVPPLLLASIALQESTYRPDARGPRGARGLLQVRPETARHVAREREITWRGEESLEKPLVNARLGAAYLRGLHDDFGGWEAALTAYNMGPTRLRKRIARGESASSPYARKVIGRWHAWEPAVPEEDGA